MNGKTLPINHGFPVRVVVPGVAGARSVKWLDRITVQMAESKNFYQQHDYKILPPAAVDKAAAEKYWHSVPAIQDMPVNSVITSPRSREKLKADPEGCIKVEGYALPGGDSGPVVKIEVTADGQKSWTEAEIIDDTGGQSKWCWVLWRAKVKLEKGQSRRILSRAVDRGGNEQAAEPEWNLRGVAYNGYGESKDLEIV
jgi:sulfite oxidase